MSNGYFKWPYMETSWVCSDGQKFKNKEDADKHEAELIAERYEKSRFN